MDTRTYRRVVVTRHGPPEVLEVIEEPAPEPAPHEARVAVLAAGVSAFDLMYRRWRWLPGNTAAPFTLGQDVVGVVDAVGHDVSSVAPGQMVAGATWGTGLGGGYAEVVCLPEDQLVQVPPGVDPAEAVCLVVNYLTAYEHLHEFGTPREGERLLVHGAAGGVGTALVQLGRLAQLHVLGVAAERHHSRLFELGATPIRRDDFAAHVRDVTSEGVDIIVDPVGGPRHLWHSYRLLRPGGRLIWLGSAVSKRAGIGPGLLTLPMVVVLGVLPDGRRAPMIPDVGGFSAKRPAWYRRTLSWLLGRLAAGELRPIVAERIPLTDARRAHELLERGGLMGKVVLVSEPRQSAHYAGP